MTNKKVFRVTGFAVDAGVKPADLIAAKMNSNLQAWIGACRKMCEFAVVYERLDGGWRANYMYDIVDGFPDKESAIEETINMMNRGEK